MKFEEVKNKNSLVLALVGDSVESLWLRKYFAENSDFTVNAITKKINKIVNANAQSESLRHVEPFLNDEEKSIVKRARNSHTHSTAKNYSVIDYRYATAFEALLGFLFLSEQKDRIDFILTKVIKFFEV